MSIFKRFRSSGGGSGRGSGGGSGITIRTPDRGDAASNTTQIFTPGLQTNNNRFGDPINTRDLQGSNSQGTVPIGDAAPTIPFSAITTANNDNINLGSGGVRGTNQSTINFDQGNIASSGFGMNTSTPIGFNTINPVSLPVQPVRTTIPVNTTPIRTSTTTTTTTSTNTGGFLAGNNNPFGGDTFVESSNNTGTAGTTGFGGNEGPRNNNVGGQLGSSVVTPDNEPDPVVRTTQTTSTTSVTSGTPITSGIPILEDIGDAASQTILAAPDLSQTLNNTTGNPTNQSTIFFDQLGGTSSGQVGMNVSAPIRYDEEQGLDQGPGGDSGNGGDTRYGTERSIYGPYTDKCDSYAGQIDPRKLRRVYLDEPGFGDIWEANKLYGLANLAAVFRGGDAWYFADDAAFRVNNAGMVYQITPLSILGRDCQPKVVVGPHNLQLRLNFTKGNNHPSANSKIEVNGSDVSNTGGFKTYNITLPYKNGTSTLYTIKSKMLGGSGDGTSAAGAGSKQSATIYRVDRVTLNGTHTIKIYKNNQLFQESSFTDNSDRSGKISNAQFTLPFDYASVPAPNFLQVTPEQATSISSSPSTYQISVRSSHNGTVSGIPSWASASRTFLPTNSTTKNYTISIGQAPNKSTPDSAGTREATLVFTSDTGKTDTHKIIQNLGEYVNPPKGSPLETKIFTQYIKGDNSPRNGTVNSAGVPAWNGKWGTDSKINRGVDIPLSTTSNEVRIGTLTSPDSYTSWIITSRYVAAEDMWLIASKKSNSGGGYQEVDTKEYIRKFDGEDEYIAPRDNNFLFVLGWDSGEIIQTPSLSVTPTEMVAVGEGGRIGSFKVIGQNLTEPITIVSTPSWVTNLSSGQTIRNNSDVIVDTSANTPNSGGRRGTITITSSGITRTVTINQRERKVNPPKTSFSLDGLVFKYAGGEFAPSSGYVTAAGAPGLNGLFGQGSQPNGYSANFTLESGIEEATLAEWTTPSVGGKQSVTQYLLTYTDENGDFEVILKRRDIRAVLGRYQEVERKRFRINRGAGDASQGSSTGSGQGSGNVGDLIALDGYNWAPIRFDFMDMGDPPPATVPPNLFIRTDTNEVWATIEVFDPVTNTTILERDVANQLDIIGSDIMSQLPSGQTSYQVKIVKKSGYKVERWTQESPQGYDLDTSKLNTFIILEGDDVDYEWRFSVTRQSPPNKVIDVYPAVNSIEFNNNSSGDTVEIPYTSSVDTAYVNVKLPNNQEKKNLSKNGNFRLDKDFFKKGLGRYTLIFCAYGADGTKGGEKTVVVNVVDRQESFYPDIRDIRFPERINGADFAGLNVPFSFSYKSVFTDYVKVYLHDKDTRIGDKFAKVDTVKLNVQDLVNMSGKYTKSGDTYTFTFLLVPFAQQGTELLEGKTEKIRIVFDEGDLKLDRNKVIKDLCDSFAANLDYEKFDEYTSTYLTHLLHFGDTNNEVISNWESDTETFRKYKVDPVTGRETNEKEEGGFDALVLKLYEPLETTVQPNQQVWITKIQSKPQLHEVIIRESSEESCPPLAGPNFSLVNNSNMGYELLDDMVASGSDSNMKLVNAFVSKSGIDTSKLDIQYVSGSITYDKTSGTYDSSSQRIYWENFSHFGSAEERVKNFYYKASLIENYKNVSASLATGDSSTSLSIIREREEQVVKIAKLENAFDGFEKFLYENTSSLSYPKDSSGELLGTGSADVLNWLTVTETSASIHDVENKNYLANNIPQFVKNDRENDDFVLFLDMIGHHFDILWTYVEALNRQRRLEHKLTRGVSDDMVREMLKSFGYTPNTTLDTAPLWEFALGQYNSANSARTDGTTKSVLTGKDRQNQIWRRILNNLPYLYKSKGTSRGLKATLSTYGIPESFLSVREFGGPHPTTGKRQKLTTVEQSFAAKMGGSSKISVPWHSGSPYPHTIEISVNTEKQQDGTIFKTDGMELKMFKDTGSLAYFEFHISGSGDIISASTDTIPFFNDTYTSFMVSRQYTSGSTHEGFDIYVKEPFQQRIRSQVSASVSASYGESSWESGSELVFEDFSGSIDNIKLWKTALSESIFDEHVLAPDMYNGNSISSSTEDLYFRLDFEVSENFAVSSSFSPSGSYKNTAPNLDLYGSTFATMSNFDSSSTYPYGGLNVIEKELTITVPNTGLGDADKIRIEEQTLLTDLSPKARATKSALKEKPIDSNKIGMFISPTKNVNIDIVKAMGSTFSIDDFIGDPRDIYEEEYTELKNFRKSFFSKYTLNYDAFYNLIKYVDNSLFQALKSQAPSRSKVVTGLLIEPHILERNKRQRKKPSGLVFEGLVGTEDISKNSIIEISSENIPFEGVLTASNLQRPTGEQNGYETTLDYNFVENLSGSNASYESTIDYDFVENLSGSQLSYESTIDHDFVNNLTVSQTSFETIISEDVNPTFSTQSVDASGNNNLSIIFEVSGALDANTSGEYFRDNIVPSQDSDISKLGYGVTAKDGHAIVTFLTPNGRRKERRKYYLITEEVTRKVKVLNISGDQSSGYKTVNETENVKKLTYVSISGSAPAVTGSITEVQPINGNLPSHYIYVKDTSTGLENSFFNGCKQTQATTIDGGPAFETFVTNPNTLKVSDSGRGSGEPILEVE